MKIIMFGLMFLFLAGCAASGGGGSGTREYTGRVYALITVDEDSRVNILDDFKVPGPGDFWLRKLRWDGGWGVAEIAHGPPYLGGRFPGYDWNTVVGQYTWDKPTSVLEEYDGGISVPGLKIIISGYGYDDVGTWCDLVVTYEG